MPPRCDFIGRHQAERIAGDKTPFLFGCEIGPSTIMPGNKYMQGPYCFSINLIRFPPSLVKKGRKTRFDSFIPIFWRWQCDELLTGPSRSQSDQTFQVWMVDVYWTAESEKRRRRRVEEQFHFFEGVGRSIIIAISCRLQMSPFLALPFATAPLT